ncbi:hypothetical protein ebA2127 [Aromatoleum aromaticum EbN1]|uniref:Uncharacterized protein n=1 Tax=Aromatoleum aromaticum (strain DSM 19018 / LMG 30748 / EbN1) TaxID=76114 RepID=Q5P5V9_AROAE|nr:hypothetical protein ebA2127 [Aromatoleum aromaticum EbN1]
MTCLTVPGYWMFISRKRNEQSSMGALCGARLRGTRGRSGRSSRVSAYRGRRRAAGLLRRGVQKCADGGRLRAIYDARFSRAVGQPQWPQGEESRGRRRDFHFGRARPRILGKTVAEREHDSGQNRPARPGATPANPRSLPPLLRGDRERRRLDARPEPHPRR